MPRYTEHTLSTNDGIVRTATDNAAPGTGGICERSTVPTNPRRLNSTRRPHADARRDSTGRRSLSSVGLRPLADPGRTHSIQQGVVVRNHDSIAGVLRGPRLRGAHPGRARTVSIGRSVLSISGRWLAGQSRWLRHGRVGRRSRVVRREGRNDWWILFWGDPVSADADAPTALDRAVHSRVVDGLSVRVGLPRWRSRAGV